MHVSTKKTTRFRENLLFALVGWLKYRLPHQGIQDNKRLTKLHVSVTLFKYIFRSMYTTLCGQPRHAEYYYLNFCAVSVQACSKLEYILVFRLFKKPRLYYTCNRSPRAGNCLFFSTHCSKHYQLCCGNKHLAQLTQ